MQQEMRSSSKLLASFGGLGLFLALAALASAEDSGKGSMTAVLHAVNKVTGVVNMDMTVGTARFTPGKSNVEVLVEVAGLRVEGSEEGVSADGEGNVYPRGVRIVNATSCTNLPKEAVDSGEKLPDVRVQPDGAGVLMASTATPMDKLAGKAVALIRPKNVGAATGWLLACGIIQSK